jgi:hypothetical protein
LTVLFDTRSNANEKHRCCYRARVFVPSLSPHSFFDLYTLQCSLRRFTSFDIYRLCSSPQFCIVPDFNEPAMAVSTNACSRILLLLLLLFHEISQPPLLMFAQTLLCSAVACMQVRMGAGTVPWRGSGRLLPGECSVRLPLK